MKIKIKYDENKGNYKNIKKTGYKLGRKRKIKKEIEFLEIKGYTISDSFVSFYKEYGELFLICTFR